MPDIDAIVRELEEAEEKVKMLRQTKAPSNNVIKSSIAWYDLERAKESYIDLCADHIPAILAALKAKEEELKAARALLKKFDVFAELEAGSGEGNKG